MSKQTTRAILREANQRLEDQTQLALLRARRCLDLRVPYIFGGKTNEGLDCSGLVTHCYPRILPDGVTQQARRLAPWLFQDSDIDLVDPGDLVFFRERHHTKDLTHVGVVDEIIPGNGAWILHASEVSGVMARDAWETQANIFRETYIAVCIAKMSLFLLTIFLEGEIEEELRSDG